MLRAEGLKHRFGAVRALDDVSFSVQPGQTLAVFGPNGAGKTTLLKVLAGLIQPQRGRAHVEGGRRVIGWIGHQPQLYGQLTVRENLRFWASLYDVSPPGDLLARLGLDDHADRRIQGPARGVSLAHRNSVSRRVRRARADGIQLRTRSDRSFQRCARAQHSMGDLHIRGDPGLESRVSTRARESSTRRLAARSDRAWEHLPRQAGRESVVRCDR